MADELHIGDATTRQVTFKNSAGTATDPTTVTATLHLPDGTTASPAITTVGVGVRSVTFTPTVAGIHRLKWQAAGTIALTEWDVFEVVADPAATQLVDLQTVKDALNITTTTHDAELRLYIAAVSEHVREHFGTLASGIYTELLTASADDGESSGRARFWPAHYPILTVTSATSYDTPTTAHTTGFTVGAGGMYFHHASILEGSGAWTVVYTAGYTSTPSDLKLAVLLDIQGLYQPAQIGPPAALGAFGIGEGEPARTFRPVSMWPRVDAWIRSRRGLVIA